MMAIHHGLVGALVLVLSVPGRTRSSHGTHRLAFASQHPNVYTFETDENGNPQTLTLPCPIVDPSPTVNYTWFREDQEIPGSMVNEEGSLIVPNITEGEYASREGVDYYCIARDDIIGFDVAIRSRSITIYYAYFDGFQEGTSAIPAALGSDVALECAILDAKPPVQIKWYNDTNEIQERTDVTFLDNRHYLFLKHLQPKDFNGQYYCAVTNANLSQEVSAPTRYVLTDTLTQGELEEYKQIGNQTAFVGNTSFQFSYIGGVFGSASNQTVNVLFWNESIEVPVKGGVGTITLPPSISPGIFPLKADIRYDGLEATRRGSLTVNQVPRITNSLEDERDRLVGEMNLTYICEFEGYPLPNLAFYFNGARIPTNNTNGIIYVVGNKLIIRSAQVSHSGIYQCIVSNEFGDDQQAWLLEIRQPILPQVQPYDFKTLNATDDRDVGALFTRESGSIVSFSVDVVAYPCPSIKWTFNGTLLTVNDNIVFNNPCMEYSENLQLNWTFTLNVTVLNTTSGSYSAELIMNHTNETIQLPKPLYITIPVPISITGLTLNETCLKKGTTVALRCNVQGFPRPKIDFRLNDVIISPQEGDFETITEEFYDQIAITNVAVNAGGQYTCIAINKQGLPQAIATEQFDFCVKPVITAATSLTPNPQIGEPFSIECMFNGTPTPNVVWKKDGIVFNETDNSMLCSREIITTDKSSRLTIAMATSLFNGTYQCNISNIAGFSSKSFPVKVQVSQNQSLSPGAIFGITLATIAVILLTILLIVLILLWPKIKEKGRKDGIDQVQKYFINKKVTIEDHKSEEAWKDEVENIFEQIRSRHPKKKHSIIPPVHPI